MPTLSDYIQKIEQRELLKRIQEATELEFEKRKNDIKSEIIAKVMQDIVIPQPIKGNKGDSIIGPPGSKGKDGLPGPRGFQGDKPIAGIDYQIPKDGRDGSPDTGKEIVDKVNVLPIQSEFQIDAKHIKGLPKIFKPLFGAIHRGGIDMIDNEVPTGTINGSNTTFTLVNTPKSGTVKVWIDGVRFGPASYSISGTTLTVDVAPVTTIVVDYQKR